MLVRDYPVLQPEYFKPYGGPPAAGSVYPDLGTKGTPGSIGEYLAERREPSDLVTDPYIRHVMAVCSGYAYETLGPAAPDHASARPMSAADRDSTNAVSEMLARLGMPNRARVVAEYIDGMLVRSTAVIVQSADRRVVILVYRGTEPTSAITWLLNAEVHSRDPEKAVLGGAGGEGYDLHVGFYRNVRATRSAILRTLKYALAGKDINQAGRLDAEDLEPVSEPPALYVTGHSLGGAMAAILGVMLATNPLYGDIAGALRSVYTFGQPMIGSMDLVDLYKTRIHGRTPLIRFVNRQDPVPHVPSAETGDFAHFGAEFRRAAAGGGWAQTYDGRQSANGRHEPVGQMRSIAGLELAFAGLPAGQVGHLDRALPYNIVDHFPQYYIESLSPHQASEFGDDEFVPVSPERRPSRGHAVRAVGGLERLVARGAAEAFKGGMRTLTLPAHLWDRHL
jgi:hypothetical protein